MRQSNKSCFGANRPVSLFPHCGACRSREAHKKMTAPVEYTFRYLAADGGFSRITHIPCKDDAGTLHKAVSGVDHEYVVLEISAGARLVWRGLRQDAVEAAGTGRR